jgi:hypothetical protein
MGYTTEARLFNFCAVAYNLELGPIFYGFKQPSAPYDWISMLDPHSGVVARAP